MRMRDGQALARNPLTRPTLELPTHKWEEHILA